MEQGPMHERYIRQLSLKDFGQQGQLRLAAAKVLVVGVGGLGCPVLQYLAAAGVGELGFADDDVVELSNLHRQVLYTMEDIGLSKVTRAAARLRQLNPGIVLHPHNMRVSNENALELIEKYDIVVDGTDNFATRYLLNDACVLLDKPLVFGGLYHYEGQVAVFNVPDGEGHRTHYRHLFPAPPSALEAPGCDEAGVLGLLPGIIGMLQAAEVIKLITGIGQPLISRLLSYNLLTTQTMIFNIDGSTMPEGLPRNREEFARTDYETWCSGRPSGIDEMDVAVFRKLVGGKLWSEVSAREEVNSSDEVIGLNEVNPAGEADRGDKANLRDRANSWGAVDGSVLFVDVREKGEEPLIGFPHLSLPLSELPGGLELVKNADQENIVVFCQSGVRSLQAAAMIRERLGDAKKLYTLAGGLKALGK